MGLYIVDIGIICIFFALNPQATPSDDKDNGQWLDKIVDVELEWIQGVILSNYGQNSTVPPPQKITTMIAIGQ